MNIRCEAVRKAVDEALNEGRTPMEVGARLPAPVQAHLEQCAPCREAAHGLLATHRALGDALRAPAEPPADAVNAVMARIRRGEAPLPEPRRSSWPALAAAAILIASCAWGMDATQAAWQPEWMALATLLADAGRALFEPLGEWWTAFADFPAPGVSATVVVLLAAAVGNWRIVGGMRRA
ncbi:MAG: hypothetical protein FJX76_16905 [Armatimonadetes bacterium]|nr:hypothetical protein [Armatimonadota bacterium]